MELALITGLCMIGLGIYLGALEISMAIRDRKVNINFTAPLVIKGQERTNGPAA